MLIILVLATKYELKRLEYPIKRNNDMATTITTDENGEETSKDDAIQWPIQVTFKLQPDLNINKQLVKIMYWDDASNSWKSDGVSDMQLNLKDMTCSFRTIHFKPTAILQVSYMS